MNDFYYFIISGLVLITMVLFVVNFILGGFFGAFMRVKGSRGKKILVKVRNPIQDYFRAGNIDEGFLVYKDRNKNERRIVLTPGCVYRASTIFWIDVDDLKNSLFLRESNQEVTGFDAVKFDNLYKRALYKPQTLADGELRIIFVMVILLLVGMFILGYLLYNMSSNVDQILSILQGVGVGVVE